jgi:hypothetical protein
MKQHQLTVFGNSQSENSQNETASVNCISNLFVINFTSKLWLNNSKMGSLNIGEHVLSFVELDIRVN